jgi:hypothetical protein
MPDHNWTCSKCGTINTPDSTACLSCGKQATYPQDYVPRCPRCLATLASENTPCEECEKEPVDLREIPGYWEQGRYHPNQIPLKKRLLNSFFSVALIAYGTFGLTIDDLYIPGKRGNGIHLHGQSAWLMYGAFICASISMLLVIADHCDQRPNQRNYKMAEKYFSYAGWGFFATSYLLAFIQL